MEQYPPVVEHAVAALSTLPGIGRKTALRLALVLLRRPITEVDTLVSSLHSLRHNVQFCSICHNLSATEVCAICSDAHRDKSKICVVENVQDVLAIEATQQYNGVYHVLGGIISPIEGVGPTDLEIASLVPRVADGTVKEVILALSATMEGDTTAFYIARQLEGFPVALSSIARGIAVGEGLEYTDEATLGRSIVSRVPYSQG